MHKITLFGFLFVFLGIQRIVQAQYFEPQSPFVFLENNLYQTAVNDKLKADRTLYTQADIDALKLQITGNHNEVEKQVSDIKNMITGVFTGKQELLKLADIRKMQEQLAVMQLSRKQIEDQIAQDLVHITYQGLYLVLLEAVDPWASKEKLAGHAEKILAPSAIEDLNGVFISSLSTVENHNLLTDRIRARISGEMTVEKQGLLKTIRNRTQFLYLIKTSVAALKKPASASQESTGTAAGHVLINLLDGGDTQEKLQAAGVPADDIESIESEVAASRETIRDFNAASSRRQQQIMRRGAANLVAVDAEIEQLENSLSNRGRLLKQAVEESTDVLFDEKNMEKSIDQAIRFFDGQLDRLKGRLKGIQEKELVARYNVNVTVEGRPEEDIAETGMDLYNQIKQTYSKAENFFRETEVAEHMLVSDKTGGGAVVYRNVEKIWLYPVAGDDDNFLLTIVARFKIIQAEQNTVVSKAEESKPAQDMVLVKGGKFKMGRAEPDDWMPKMGECVDAERPIHAVVVDDFYIDAHEVTNAQYCRFLNEKGNQIEGGAVWLEIHSENSMIRVQDGRFVPVGGFENHPVVMVTWFGANAYANWADKRLPTEAEWEYAARGGVKSRGFLYGGSDEIDEVAWDHDNSGLKSHPVGTKQPNELGLYDMSGNAWEWCSDWFDEGYYGKSLGKNPTGPLDGKEKIIRGGGWNSVRQINFKYRKYYSPCKVACRNNLTREEASFVVGFRCVR
jgi:formylglycine-generating enzyme